MDALAFFNRGDPPQAGRMLFMPDPTLTGSAPRHAATSRADVYISFKKDPEAALYRKSRIVNFFI
jgi:hypothetical protein